MFSLVRVVFGRYKQEIVDYKNSNFKYDITFTDVVFLLFFLAIIFFYGIFPNSILNILYLISF